MDYTFEFLVTMLEYILNAKGIKRKIFECRENVVYGSTNNLSTNVKLYTTRSSDYRSKMRSGI